MLGYPVDPLAVVEGGTRHKHATWGGVQLQLGESTSSPRFRIVPLDAALVSPGDIHHLLRYTDDQPALPEGGMHFSLMNNLWGTAFPQWYDDNGLSRFTLELSA